MGAELLGVRSWIFIDLYRFRDRILKAFLSSVSKTGVFLFACFQLLSFMTFWAESGRMELEEQALSVGENARRNCSPMSGFCRFQGHSSNRWFSPCCIKGPCVVPRYVGVAGELNTRLFT